MFNVNSSLDSEVINSAIITANVISEESTSFSNLVDPVILVFKHTKQVRNFYRFSIVIISIAISFVLLLLL